jgi:hypothetical protein
MYTVMLKNEFARIYYDLIKKYNVQFDINEPGTSSMKPVDHQIGIPHSPGYGLEEKRKALYESLINLKEGVSLLTLHPVIDSPEIRYIIPDWEHRYDEYLLFMEDGTMDEIKKNRIRLIDFTSL